MPQIVVGPTNLDEACMPLSFNDVAVKQIAEAVSVSNQDQVDRKKAAVLADQGLSADEVDIYFSRRYGMPKGFGRSLYPV